jgi:SAM-dependent methyltransferase
VISSQESGEAAVFTQYASWYDAFNAGKDYGAEVRYLLGHIETLTGSPRRWLDIGCGTGQHLRHIQSRGIEVEGLDQSWAMIERARQLCSEITFHAGSAQDFALDGERDVVSMLFHVMSYQHSDEMVRSAMERARAHLATTGVFVFDFWNSEGVAADPPTERVREAVVDGRSLFRLSHPIERRDERLIEVKYQFRWDFPDGPLVHEEVHVMRHFTDRELETFLKDARLRLIRSEAWMAHRPLSVNDWYGFICACPEQGSR